MFDGFVTYLFLFLLVPLLSNMQIFSSTRLHKSQLNRKKKFQFQSMISRGPLVRRPFDSSELTNEQPPPPPIPKSESERHSTGGPRCSAREAAAGMSLLPETAVYQTVIRVAGRETFFARGLPPANTWPTPTNWSK